MMTMGKRKRSIWCLRRRDEKQEGAKCRAKLQADRSHYTFLSYKQDDGNGKQQGYTAPHHALREVTWT